MAETINSINTQGTSYEIEDTVARDNIRLLSNIINAISDTIPKNTSSLKNDSGFITNKSVPTKLSQLQNDANFVTPSAIPTRISALQNDTEFITKSDLLKFGTIKVDADLSEYYKKSEIDAILDDLDVDVDMADYYTKADVNSAIAQAKADIVNGAPEQLDTLKEISDVLKNNENTTSALLSSIGNKVDSTKLNDYYTKTEINGKLENLTDYVTKDEISEFIKLDDIVLDEEASEEDVNYVLGKEGENVS